MHLGDDPMRHIPAPQDSVAEARAFTTVEEALFRHAAPPVVIGRYTLRDKIAAGGGGAVFTAYDPQLNREIAIKTHLLSRFGGAGGRARLLREAQAAAKLTHPNVVRIYDVGTFYASALSLSSERESGGEDALFVAMELIDGMDLEQWIEVECRSWREVVRVFIEAGQGLMEAHAAGIVHRDFKPANVLIARDGRVLVADFGLAKSSAATGSDASGYGPRAEPPAGRDACVTVTGSTAGTPAFMAPEQHGSMQVDARADQFSFCASLYRCLFGALPYGGRLDALRHAKGRGDVQPIPRDTAAPRWLQQIVLRGLRSDPDERYPDMRRLLVALRRDPTRRRRRATQLLAGGLVATIGVAAGASYSTRPGSCEVHGEAMSALWNAQRRESLTAALAASSAPYVAEIVDSVGAQIDGYVTRWKRERTMFCEQSAGRSGRFAADAQVQCFDRCVEELGALLELLQRADRTMATQAPVAIAMLHDPARCSDRRLFRAQIEPPSAESEAVVREGGAQLARARAQYLAGRYSLAAKTIGGAKRSALETEYDPLLARVLHLEGAIADKRGDYDAASTALLDASLIAERLGDDSQRAESLLSLVLTEGAHAAHFSQGERYARQAEAVIDRIGGDATLRSRLDLHRGAMRHQQGRDVEALASFESALALHLEADPNQERGGAAASLMQNIGMALYSQGRYEQSREVLEGARTELLRALPAHHPQIGRVLGDLGNTYHALGRYDDAWHTHQEALAIAIASWGDQHPSIARHLNNLGNTLGARGEYERALDHYERALAIKQRHYPSDHLGLVTTLSNLAEVLNELGRPTEALAHAEQAEQIEAVARGPDAVGLSFSMTERGRALLALGRRDEAVAALEQALEIRRGSPADTAKIRLLLAVAVEATNPDRATALYRGLDTPEVDRRSDLDRVRRWIRDNLR